MAYRTIRGSILYTSKKPERMDEERGREFFTLPQQDDGTESCSRQAPRAT